MLSLVSEESGICLSFKRANGRSPTVQLALVSRHELDLTSDGSRRLGGRVHGCLGVLALGSDLFVGVIESGHVLGQILQDVAEVSSS